ncbi:FtsQ-type POTRA domain-containing protein [Candidatus Peregrinibacteria bacterium]|nr:FtsQ-type POTRA domain-containing protein [Candidatus Peregrinibacteria bacterium]
MFKKKKPKKVKKSTKISKLSSPYRKALPNSKQKTRRIRQTRSINAPQRLQNIQKPSSWKLTLTIVLILILGSLGVHGVFFSDYFLIEDFKIEEEGTLIDNYEKMSAILKKVVGENILFIKSDALKKELLEAHPEIESIKIKKIFPDTVKIEYDKYPVVANIVNIVNGVQKRFIADSQGFLVEENNEHPDLPYIYYNTDEPLELRHSFLTSEAVSQKRLKQIINAVKLYEEKFAMHVLYAKFLKAEREVHLYTEKRFFVLLDLDEKKSINKQIQKLIKALTKLDIYNTPLDYIDLRISGTQTEKVIFKRA